MFTGIIEATGKIVTVNPDGSNISFQVESAISNELKADQSVSHDGVCLTVESVSANTHIVTAIAETLSKTTLGNWQVNDIINLERCMQMNGRIDGHLVQGHVDATVLCTVAEEKNGSWLYRFSVDEKFAPLIIEKGSVCLNGISLTAFNVSLNSFSVAIIPYTYQHTNINTVRINSTVNIEFDIIGKYLARYKELFGK